MFRRKETARGQNERVAEEVAALRQQLAESESRVAQLEADNAGLQADNAYCRNRFGRSPRPAGFRPGVRSPGRGVLVRTMDRGAKRRAELRYDGTNARRAGQGGGRPTAGAHI